MFSVVVATFRITMTVSTRVLHYVSWVYKLRIGLRSYSELIENYYKHKHHESKSAVRGPPDRRRYLRV